MNAGIIVLGYLSAIMVALAVALIAGIATDGEKPVIMLILFAVTFLAAAGVFTAYIVTYDSVTTEVSGTVIKAEALTKGGKYGGIRYVVWAETEEGITVECEVQGTTYAHMKEGRPVVMLKTRTTSCFGEENDKYAIQEWIQK